MLDMAHTHRLERIIEHVWKVYEVGLLMSCILQVILDCAPQNNVREI